jgi:predicted nuclease of predicted toxin-antitoxin system
VILWLDNQLPAALASWMRAAVDVECLPIRDLNLQRASDIDIFLAARAAGAVVITKDADFAVLIGQHGPPPQVVLVTCGNTSNTRLREVVGAQWATVRIMLERGEPLVELGEQPR